MKRKISVVIPTYNQKKDMLLCLKSLYEQTSGIPEVIVVDNASKDGTADAVESNFPKVKLIRNKKNEGVTGAVARGLKLVTGDYVCLVDHDMVLDKKMLEVLSLVLDTRKDVGLVVGKILYKQDKKRIWAAGTGINLTTGKINFRGGEDLGQYEAAEEIQVAPANFMARTSFIKKRGLYDPIYIIGYEDTDLSFKMRKYGYKVWYTPDALSYHNIPLSEDGSEKRLLSRTYWVARNRIIFMKRWGNFSVFLFFLMPFSLYYLFLAIKHRDPMSFYNYMRGLIQGILV